MLIEGVKLSNGQVLPLAVDDDGKLLISGVTLDGDVTIGAAVEISNDEGNPVPVSGTVTAEGPLTDTELRATAVPVSGPLTDAQLRASDVKVTLDSEAVVIGAGSATIGKLGANSGVDIGDVDVTSLPSLPAGGNSIGAVASNSVLSSATVTRPADTAPYVARDVISTAVGAAIEFSGMARAVGGTGTIVKARLMTNQSTNTAQYRLHLFHTAPTAIADNAQYAMLDANKDKRIGMIDFPAAATEGTGSDAAASMRPSSDGSYPPPNLWYKCAAADTKLYGILETLSAFTPASGQTVFIELGADGLS
jgi:hypothetical protein